MNNLPQMNIAQTLFTVFFAVFWGTVANVQPKWKAFQWPLVGRVKPVKFRVLWAFLVLNVFELGYFGWALGKLGDAKFACLSGLGLVWRGVIPAFAAFGFYRLWFGLVELRPLWFYLKRSHNLPPEFRKSEPTVEELWYPRNIGGRLQEIPITTGCQNLLFALLYLIAAVVPLVA
jgi:hypothetical protein